MSSSSQAQVAPAFKNILFATDFSPCSQAAIPYACTLARLCGSTIHVLHVLAPEPMLEVPLDLSPELDADLDLARTTLKTLLASKPFGNIPTTVSATRGPLWPVVEAFIEEHNIDLIVLGTHGRRGLKKMILGSVAEQVFRHARCPVLTVGPQSVYEETPSAKIATILFATDFSHGSQHALSYAESLARVNGARLILTHVVSALPENEPVSFIVGQAIIDLSSESVEDALLTAREQVKEMISYQTQRELKPEVIVECGPAAETILSVAKRKAADLIVMGAHRASGSSVASHLPWATASSVVCQAHCPVLTVRS